MRRSAVLCCIALATLAIGCGREGVDVVLPTPPTNGTPSPGSTEQPTNGSPSPVPTPDPTRLDELTVAPEVPREGYDRSLFRHWSDLDGDGCDTRREVLIEESLAAVSIVGSCNTVGGLWFSPYDGRTLSDPSGLDIDHFVPLAEAWDSGANIWSASRRELFANDLDHPNALIAVSASSNRSKGDKDPAEWMPPQEDFGCAYAATWVDVKLTWELSVDETELSALRGVLENCVE